MVCTAKSDLGLIFVVEESSWYINLLKQYRIRYMAGREHGELRNVGIGLGNPPTHFA